ncbi:MAG: carboxypeptidase-like regulatory domain-containing protein [Candidatus Hydrogenedentales bacterium]|jgi:hypothetical protein
MTKKKAPATKKPAAKKATGKKPAGIAFTAVVLDSMTKQPLPRAKVSVFGAGKRTASDTKLTNAEGKAKLTAKPGKAYRVAAEKTKYCKTVVETNVMSEGVVARLRLLPEDRHAAKLRGGITIYFFVYHCTTEDPIQGASCSVRDVGTNVTYTATTDSDGMVTFNNIPTNRTYELKAQKSGFTTVTYTLYLTVYDNEGQFDFPLCPT